MTDFKVTEINGVRTITPYGYGNASGGPYCTRPLEDDSGDTCEGELKCTYGGDAGTLRYIDRPEPGEGAILTCEVCGTEYNDDLEVIG